MVRIERIVTPLSSVWPADSPGKDSNSSPVHDSSGRTPRTVTSVVTDKDLAWLGSRLGSEWEQVGMLYLDMSKADIYHCKQDNPLNVVNQITDMLNKWKSRQGPAATYALLLHRLGEMEDFDRSLLEELERRASSSTDMCSA